MNRMRMKGETTTIHDDEITIIRYHHFGTTADASGMDEENQDSIIMLSETNSIVLSHIFLIYFPYISVSYLYGIYNQSIFLPPS